ncbi:MAG TPA: peptidylprolyl isomerase [Gemmatimonadaceae bacterium]|nr:peptidylprolyl isomerase [Gemmatimonadaceae bacterium]
MNPFRRLLLFSALLGASSISACAPFNRAATRARAVQDSVHMPLSLATPDSFLVAFETTRGRFDVLAHSRWAPVGAHRFYELVHRHFYDSVVVFRVVKGFVAQFGISGDPAVSAAWRVRRIADDPVREGNKRGRLAFARGGPGTRTTQLFINFSDNVRLDTSGTIGFPAFAEVVRGMDVVDSLYSEYGGAPSQRQDSISRQGNAYLHRAFPKLDMIRSARIIQEWRRPPA